MYKKSKKFSNSIVILLFCYFLFLNYCQPLAMDDFWRAINDVVVNHTFFSWLHKDYVGWTGRMSAQGLSYIFFSKTYIVWSVFIINTLNAMALTAFMIFSFKLVSKDRFCIGSKNFIFYAFVFMFIFAKTGFIGQVLWKTAAIQFFWGFTILTILFYYLLVKDEEYKSISLITGLFIGLYNEQFVGVLMLFCVAYFFERWLTKNTINKGVIFFAIGCFVGGVILVAAPGNYARMEQMEPQHTLSLFEQFKGFYFTYKYSVWPDTQIVTWLFVVFIVLALTNPNNYKKSVFIYTLTLGLSLMVMFPVFQSYGLLIRLMLIYYIIFFLAVFYQFYDSDNEFLEVVHSLIRRFYTLPLFGLIVLMFMLGNTYFLLHELHIQRQSLMKQYHEKHLENVSLPSSEVPSMRNFGLTDVNFTCNTNDPNNQAFAKYYGFKTVKAENC